MASRFLQKNPNIFIGGCPCHLAHITAGHANDAFSNAISTNVEVVCVDCFYWFDKSTKRKGKLVQYYEFCDQDYQSVLRCIFICWLSLERCIGRSKSSIAKPLCLFTLLECKDRINNI